MKNTPKSKRGFTLVELLVVIVIIASLAGLTAPQVIRQRKKADQTEAISNAKQIGLALLEFDTEYGSYPGANTAQQVTDNTQTQLTFAGGASNDYFRQIMGAGYTTSEQIFYCKVPGVTKPDNNITGAAALAGGEVGFAYITGAAGVGLSSGGNSARPIVVTPVDGNGPSFLPGPYDSKAVILRMDNSATSLQILPTGAVNASPGLALLAGGATSVWGTDVPALAVKANKAN
jgi:prepilin-type N-terminal cleavage/methylation domain-containing protein